MDVSVQESPNSQAFPVGRNSKALEPWGYSVSDFFAPGLDLGSSGAKQSGGAVPKRIWKSRIYKDATVLGVEIASWRPTHTGRAFVRQPRD